MLLFHTAAPLTSTNILLVDDDGVMLPECPVVAKDVEEVDVAVV
jgi:hypothetical protein